MKKDNLIFIHKLIKAIADAIIKVFIPLYILKSTGELSYAMGYLVVYSLFVMLYMFVLKRIIEKYGVICIMLHFIPVIATEAILSFAPLNMYYVLAAAALMAMAQALYSIPLNLIFTFGDKKTNVGKFEIATNIGKLVFTLVSGLILASTIQNSFLILSIASSLFYIACVFPLFFAYRELKENYNSRKHSDAPRVKLDKWFIVFHISFGLFQPIMDNVVPLYLYVNNLSFQSVTYMIVLVEFLKILVNYFSQFMVKKNKAIILVIISSILFIGSSIVMLLVKVPVVLYIFSCTCSISFPLTFVPMFRLYCNYLKKTNNVFYGITRRDFDIFSCRPAMYALSFIGLGLIPCMIVGVCAVPVMLISELKLLKGDKDESVS